MNRRTWTMVGSVPASMVLAALAMASGIWQLVVAVLVAELVLVSGLMGVDASAHRRQSRRFNEWVSEHPNGSPEWQAWRTGRRPAEVPAEPAPSGTPAVCESCRGEPATQVVISGGRGFRVCPGCVPVPAREAGHCAVGLLVLAPVAVGGVVGLAWAVHRVGDLVVPLKILAVPVLLVAVLALLAVGVGGLVYAFDRATGEPTAAPGITVHSIGSSGPVEHLPPSRVIAGQVEQPERGLPAGPGHHLGQSPAGSRWWTA
jgi:hypothetical protein